MKTYFKFVATMLMCMIAFFTMSYTIYADSDNIAPVVTSVNVKTLSVDKGSNAQIDLAVIEDETGIASINVTLYAYIGENASPVLIYGEADYTGEDAQTQYTGNILIDIPTSAGDAAGKYYVGYIEIIDNAGNKNVYFDHFDSDGYIVEEGESYLKLYGNTGAEEGCLIIDGANIIVNSTGDDVAPILTNVTFSSTKVEKTDDIYAKFDVIEESDIYDLDLTYEGYKNGQNILIGNWPVEFSRDGDVITSAMDIVSYNTAGTYYLTSIRVTDSHGNTREYRSDTLDNGGKYYEDDKGYYLVDENDESIRCYVDGGATIEVISDGDDEAPFIESITIKKDSVFKPGMLPIEINLDKEDDIMNITVIVNRYGQTELESYDNTWSFYGQKKSSYTINFPIATDMNSDKYYIESIQIMDCSGNMREYASHGIDDNPYIEEDGVSYMVDRYDFSVRAPFISNSMFEVVDEFDVEFEVALSNSNLISKIESMEEGKTARIYIDGKGIATKEMFEAIQQKDKTLVFYNNNYQWVFNGLDVTNPKDIELKIAFSVVDGSDYQMSGNLLKIDFAPNGQLPGIANVRVKSDYTFDLFEMTNAMYLYYLDEGNILSYESDSDINYVLDGSDHWCQFNITHNSTYMVSGDKMKIAKMSISSISKKLAAGKKMTLSVTTNFGSTSAKKFKWSSSNKKYATVNSNGVVTAKNAGKGKKVKITAKATDGSGKKATITITVMKNSVKSVKLKASSTSVKAGKTLKITSTVKTTGKNANTTLKWQSSNKKYATVTSNGKVKAKKAGKGKKVKITAMATDGSGKKATLTIKIK